LNAASPSAISRGEFGAVVTERLLQMRAGWENQVEVFIPGHTSMGNDYTPYYCRIGDVPAQDGPYVFGHEVDMVEIPVTWELDDFPAFEWLYGVNQGLSAASQFYERWAGDFDYLCEFGGEGVYCLTMHPQVIGRGHRLLMLHRLVEHMKERVGVTWWFRQYSYELSFRFIRMEYIWSSRDSITSEVKRAVTVMRKLNAR
jgi:hypothetical protein